nr:MAG TPA: hypothetical protein [Caudoviricetes sp.]
MKIPHRLHVQSIFLHHPCIDILPNFIFHNANF